MRGGVLHTLCFEDCIRDQVIAGGCHVVDDIDILQTDGELESLGGKRDADHHVVQEIELSTLGLRERRERLAGGWGRGERGRRRGGEGYLDDESGAGVQVEEEDFVHSQEVAVRRRRG